MRLRVLRLHGFYYAAVIKLGRGLPHYSSGANRWMFVPERADTVLTTEQRLVEWLRDGCNGEFKKEKY